MTKPKDAGSASSQSTAPLEKSAGQPSEKTAENLSQNPSFAQLLKNKEIKKLLDMGVQRGFLTFEEVAELLPPEIISSDAIDEVMILLAENEIEVMDSTKKPKE